MAHVGRFKQQRLPAWQPILSPTNTLPVFVVIGLGFVPLGILLLVTSNEVRELFYDYTDCKNQEKLDQTCAEYLEIWNRSDLTCYCSLPVKLETDFPAPVFLYYGLTNFYQNHRRFVRSRDDEQLHGKNLKPDQLKMECYPFRTVEMDGVRYGYAPCGAIANAMFNDTIVLTMVGNVSVELLGTGIAWDSDKEVKYHNPKSWSGFIKPRNWEKEVWELDPDVPDNNGYENEDLMVWMKLAPFSTFRKLYRRVDHSRPPFEDKLPQGYYNVDIAYNYPVVSFEGRKFFVISTASALGGKNPFLGIAYIVVGCLNLIIAGLLGFYVLCTRRPREDPTFGLDEKDEKLSDPSQRPVASDVPSQHSSKTASSVKRGSVRSGTSAHDSDVDVNVRSVL